MRTLLTLLLFCNCQRTEDAVTRSLRYLARHQSEDGSWGRFDESCRCRFQPAIETALPILIDGAVELRFRRLLEDLADDRTPVREAAQREIEALGSRAAPLLQKALGHPDAEVAFRCREALKGLWAGDPEIRGVRLRMKRMTEDDFQVLATGLGLLCFLGAGYAPFSKEEWTDATGRVFNYGRIVKKAATWLVERQQDDGWFSTGNAAAQAVATTALCELYGMTAAVRFKEPADSSVDYLNKMSPTDPVFQVWKGIALRSAALSEIPAAGAVEVERTVELLAKENSPMSLSVALLLRSGWNHRNEEIRKRFSEADLQVLSPMEAWLVTCAVGRLGSRGLESLWAEIPKAQALGVACEAGSWRLNGEDREETLMTTLYTTLTMERYYRYNNALFPSQ